MTTEGESKFEKFLLKKFPSIIDLRIITQKIMLFIFVIEVLYRCQITAEVMKSLLFQNI